MTESVGHFMIREPMFWVAMGLVCILIGTVAYSVYIRGPEIDKQAKLQQSLLDSMSCQQLGKWLIDNSKNYTDSYGYVEKNYHYAESKYLVCTHGGLSP